MSLEDKKPKKKQKGNVPLYIDSYSFLTDRERSIYNNLKGKKKAGALTPDEESYYNELSAKVETAPTTLANLNDNDLGHVQTKGIMSEEDLKEYNEQAAKNSGEVFAPEDQNQGLGSTVAVAGVRGVGNAKTKISQKGTQATPISATMRESGLNPTLQAYSNTLEALDVFGPSKATLELDLGKENTGPSANSVGMQTTEEAMQKLNQSDTKEGSSKNKGLYDPVTNANKLNTLIGGGIEAGGIAWNLNNLLRDKKMPLPTPVKGISGNAIRLYAPDVYSGAKEDIKANTVRQNTLALESGVPGATVGVGANANAAINKAKIAQGRLDAEAINKTSGANLNTALKVAFANNQNDWRNKQMREKAKMDKFKIINQDENALFQGFKNIGAIAMNSNYQNALNKVKSQMYEDGQHVQFINGIS